MSDPVLARIRRVIISFASVPHYLIYYPLKGPRKTLSFLRSVYHHQRSKAIASVNRNLVPTVEPLDLFPELFEEPVRIAELGSAPSGTSYFESYLLACLVQYLSARTLFEFGTSQGRTTLQLALNSPEDAIVYTLDLPESKCETRFARAFPHESDTRNSPIGSLFMRHVESRKIRQMLADSASISFQCLRGQMDFIFIDGDHAYEYVKADSENALLMLSQNGVIVWHDYGSRWSDVPRYICELAEKQPRTLYHLAGTCLVVYIPFLAKRL